MRQLRIIWKVVDPFTNVRSPAAHAKKAVWVEHVRRVFFLNDACTVPNDAIISQLPTGEGLSSTPVPSRPQHVAQINAHAQAQAYAAAMMDAARANAAASRAFAASHQQPRSQPPPAHNRSAQALARQQLQPSYGSQFLAGRPNAGPQSLARRPQANASMHTNTTAHVQIPNAAAAALARQQAQNFAFQQAAAAAGLSIAWMPPSFQVSPTNSAPMPPAPASITTAASNANVSNKKVKQEPGRTASTISSHDDQDDSYWETRARTNIENEMVIQLRQMGFTDMREMLTGIRHVVNAPADIPSQVESVMMWIVAQREEAEEARKIDAARARSESLRAEQARLRKQAAHERMWSSSIEDWRSQSDLFQGSIVLKEAKECLETRIFDNRDYKEKLIRFLELEKKARKWYGTSVPWCFFCHLCQRWNEMSTQELVQSIEEEATCLETAMYSLSQQEGGVPKIFRQARANAEKDGRPTSPIKEKASADNDDSDDDVIVVKEVSASQADSRMNAVSNDGKKCEVIDLL